MGYTLINLGFFSFYNNILLSVIPICICFFLLDIYVFVYGISDSKKLIKITIFARIATLIILSIIIFFNDINIKYMEYLYAVSLGILAGAVSTTISFSANCYIFNFFIIIK